jgi:hypothetical protein
MFGAASARTASRKRSSSWGWLVGGKRTSGVGLISTISGSRSASGAGTGPGRGSGARDRFDTAVGARVAPEGRSGTLSRLSSGGTDGPAADARLRRSAAAFFRRFFTRHERQVRKFWAGSTSLVHVPTEHFCGACVPHRSTMHRDYQRVLAYLLRSRTLALRRERSVLAVRRTRRSR